jgi:hypothetical protein
VHIDAPDNDVTLTTNTGIRCVGRYRYLRSVTQERVFAFCCSTEFDAGLFTAFDADTCVVIHDLDAFFTRCRVAARTPLPLDSPVLIHGAVSYFAPRCQSHQGVEEPTTVGSKEFHLEFHLRALWILVSSSVDVETREFLAIAPSPSSRVEK